MKQTTFASTGGSPITAVRIATVVAIAGAIATVVLVGALTRPDHASSTSRSGGFGTSRTTDGAVVSNHKGAASIRKVSPTTPSATGVVIPTGADQVDGHPTGFPATDLGAVAIQIELARAQLGFDYDEAARVASLYANPADRTVFEQRARASVDQRRQQAGVALQGKVAAPASYAVTPLAYTLEELAPGYYAVNLLSYVTLTAVDGTSKDNLTASTQLVRWIDGDWRLVEGSAQDIDRLVTQDQPKAVAPGTTHFAQAGWIAISGAAQ